MGEVTSFGEATAFRSVARAGGHSCGVRGFGDQRVGWIKRGRARGAIVGTSRSGTLGPERVKRERGGIDGSAFIPSENVAEMPASAATWVAPSSSGRRRGSGRGRVLAGHVADRQFRNSGCRSGSVVASWARYWMNREVAPMELPELATRTRGSMTRRAPRVTGAHAQGDRGRSGVPVVQDIAPTRRRRRRRRPGTGRSRNRVGGILIELTVTSWARRRRRRRAACSGRGHVLGVDDLAVDGEHHLRGSPIDPVAVRRAHEVARDGGVDRVGVVVVRALRASPAGLVLKMARGSAGSCCRSRWGVGPGQERGDDSMEVLEKNAWGAT